MPIAAHSQHTQNNQSNKGIGKNGKMFLLFYGKKVIDFLANPIEKLRPMIWILLLKTNELL